MIRRVLLATVALTAATPSFAHAQNAFAGWVGLVTTPVGAFAPQTFVPAGTAGDHGPGVQARYGHWQFAPDDDNTTNLGIALTVPARRGRVAFEVGYSTKKGCPDCDAAMVGIDLHVPIATEAAGGSGLAIAINPEAGFMTETDGGDLSALGAAVNVPVSYPVALGQSARFVPFVSPGAGLGVITANGESEAGLRFIIGAGAAIESLASGLRASVGLSKIVIDEGATVFGVALGYGR